MPPLPSCSEFFIPVDASPTSEHPWGHGGSQTPTAKHDRNYITCHLSSFQPFFCLLLHPVTKAFTLCCWILKERAPQRSSSRCWEILCSVPGPGSQLSSSPPSQPAPLLIWHRSLALSPGCAAPWLCDLSMPALFCFLPINVMEIALGSVSGFL